MSETTERIIRIKRLLNELETASNEAALGIESQLGNEFAKLLPLELNFSTLKRLIFRRGFFEDDDTQIVIKFLEEQKSGNHSSAELVCPKAE